MATLPEGPEGTELEQHNEHLGDQRKLPPGQAATGEIASDNAASRLHGPWHWPSGFMQVP